MKADQLTQLRNELSVKAKNGIDFTLAAAIIWFAIYFIWNLDFSAYNRSILVFCIGAPLLPLVFLFSKIMNTEWKIPTNPLQPLGLWFNFAQLFYFPFLILVLIKFPDYFLVTYAIITGAHLFPYSRFYNNRIYAVFAAIIHLSSLLLTFVLTEIQHSYIALFTSCSLLVLTIILYVDFKSKKQKYSAKFVK